MSRPDTENAHVRKGRQSKRQQPDVLAEEARQLLESPAFDRAFETVREGCVKVLEEMQHDGSPEMEDHEREICRTLRNLYAVKRNLSLAVQRKQLRLLSNSDAD